MSDRIPDADFDPDAFMSVEESDDNFVESLDTVDDELLDKKEES
jgi:hypothetical protein